MSTLTNFNLKEPSIRKCIDFGASKEEIKRIRVDYDIRCVQIVALCLFGAHRLEQQDEFEATLSVRIKLTAAFELFDNLSLNIRSC
jgi:hypothetical protein